MDNHNPSDCVVSFRVTCCLFIIFQINYFLWYYFLFQLCISLSGYLIYNRAQFLCNFHFLMLLLLHMLHLISGPFILRMVQNGFQGSGLPLSGSGYWSYSMCKAHIAFQELQAVAMMLYRISFQLSGKVVALHFDNCTAKAYFCYKGGTVSPFLSRLTCQILSLTDKHRIILITACTPTHLNVKANYLS